MAISIDDDRPIPPLGYCANCIRVGVWLEARTMWQGTALCATCLVTEVAGASDDVEDDARESGRDPAVLVVDELRSGIQFQARNAGF